MRRTCATVTFAVLPAERGIARDAGVGDGYFRLPGHVSQSRLCRRRDMLTSCAIPRVANAHTAMRAQGLAYAFPWNSSVLPFAGGAMALKGGKSKRTGSR